MVNQLQQSRISDEAWNCDWRRESKMEGEGWRFSSRDKQSHLCLHCGISTPDHRNNQRNQQPNKPGQQNSGRAYKN
jgi:hypothetical protein